MGAPVSPNLKLAAVWIALAAGLVLALSHVPMPGVEGPAAPSEPPRDSQALEAGSADEAYGQGLLALERGLPEEAAAAFDRALALDPTRTAARVQKAFALARIEGTKGETLRGLLNGFDRTLALANEEKAIARGAPGGPGRFHLERAVLLGFGRPPDPEAALKALAAAREAGLSVPSSLEAALSEPQVDPAAGR